MTSENPFEVSTLFRDSAIPRKPYESRYDFDLEDNLIVCGSNLNLPPICVYTGVTDDIVPFQKQTMFPSMKLVIVQRSVSVLMFAARSELARRGRRSLILGVTGFAGFALAIGTLLMQEARLAILFPIGVFIACVSLFLFNRQSMPLQLVRYKAPGIYWVRGFSKAFLAQLAMDKVNHIGRTSHTTEADTRQSFEI